MTNRVTTRSLRHRILAKRGLESRKVGKQMRIVPAGEDAHKTDKMRLIERELGVPIEQLIEEGTIYEVAKRLGVHPTTIYHWRARFGMI